MEPRTDQGAGHTGDIESYRLILDSAPALPDPGRADGSLDFFNQSWLSYVGQPEENLLGWAWTAFIHPEDIDDLQLKWRKSIATGKEFEAEARVRRADGRYRWMLHRKVRRGSQEGIVTMVRVEHRCCQADIRHRC